jgi:hypothetical protein
MLARFSFEEGLKLFSVGGIVLPIASATIGGGRSALPATIGHG